MARQAGLTGEKCIFVQNNGRCPTVWTVLLNSKAKLATSPKKRYFLRLDLFLALKAFPIIIINFLKSL